MSQEPWCTLGVGSAAVKREQEACSDAQEAAVRFARSPGSWLPQKGYWERC